MTALLGESKAVAAPAQNRRPMPAPVPCFNVVRRMKNAFNYRLRLVMYARQDGRGFEVDQYHRCRRDRR